MSQGHTSQPFVSSVVETHLPHDLSTSLEANGEAGQ